MQIQIQLEVLVPVPRVFDSIELELDRTYECTNVGQPTSSVEVDLTGLRQLSDNLP